MIWVDYVIIAFIGLSAVISLARGFVREALSLATWVLAFWVALSFSGDLAIRLERWIGDDAIQLGVAFLILLIITLIVGVMINMLVAKLVHKTGLTGTDRTLGVLFGVVRGGAIVAGVVLVAGLSTIPEEPWWERALLLPYFEDLALWIVHYLPGDLAEEVTFGDR